MHSFCWQATAVLFLTVTMLPGSWGAPNIILVVTDDQGYGDLGRLGNPVLKTPHLDAIYDQSVRLTDFRVSPTCSPTRSALMTGRHEFRNGVTHTIFERERLTLNAITLPEVLRTSGYTTGIFGKWHLGDEAEYRPERRGFDEVFIHGAGGIGQTYPGTCGDAPKNSYFSPVILHNNTFEKTEGYCTDVFFRQALQWIEESKKKQQPFFCYIPTNAPHGPLDCPEEYSRRYRDQVPDDVARFFGMITNIDDNMGTLIRKLDDWDLSRNTLVVFMNDNGGTAGVQIFNAGMKGSKGQANNGSTRAMSLWRWPGRLKPADIGHLTAHIDIFPTFVEVAGCQVPNKARSQWEGISLWPLLTGHQTENWPDRILMTHLGRWDKSGSPQKFGTCSVRWREYLLVREGKKLDTWGLYDLKADPEQKKNLAELQPDIVKSLDAAYSAWWESVQPDLVNEKAWMTAPKMNPFHELYWKQYAGSGPNNAPPPEGFLK